MCGGGGCPYGGGSGLRFKSGGGGAVMEGKYVDSFNSVLSHCCIITWLALYIGGQSFVISTRQHHFLTFPFVYIQKPGVPVTVTQEKSF